MAGKKTVTNDFQANTDAQKTAAKLPELNLLAQKLASQIYGLRKRGKPGPGTDFHRFAPYVEHIHDPRKIDHKASAGREDREGNEAYLIREREMEVSQKFYFWCDNSKSMDYKAPADLFPDQPPYTKKETAEILMLTTAYLAIAAGEHYTLLGSALNLNGNKHGISRIIQELEHRQDTVNDTLPKLPVHRGKPLERGSHVFIFSDFLCPIEEIAETIKSLHSTGVRGHLVQILDPSEIEFRYKGHVKFKSMEDDFSHTVKKSEAVKQEMEEHIKNHIKDINDLVARIPSWTFSSYVTDQPLHEALLPLYGIKPGRAPSATVKKTPRPD